MNVYRSLLETFDHKSIYGAGWSLLSIYGVCVCICVTSSVRMNQKRKKKQTKCIRKEKEKTREQRPAMKYGALVSLWSSSALAMPFHIKSKEAKDFINKFSFPLLGSTRKNCATLRPWVGRELDDRGCAATAGLVVTRRSQNPPTQMVKSPFSFVFFSKVFLPVVRILYYLHVLKW